MLLNEQKKQALELYINQNHTQHQIANSLSCPEKSLHLKV